MKAKLNAPGKDKVSAPLEAEAQLHNLRGNNDPEISEQLIRQTPYELLLIAVQSGNKQNQLRVLALLDDLDRTFRRSIHIRVLSRTERLSVVQCFLAEHGLTLDSEVQRKHYGKQSQN